MYDLLPVYRLIVFPTSRKFRIFSKGYVPDASSDICYCNAEKIKAGTKKVKSKLEVYRKNVQFIRKFAADDNKY